MAVTWPSYWYSKLKSTNSQNMAVLYLRWYACTKWDFTLFNITYNPTCGIEFLSSLWVSCGALLASLKRVFVTNSCQKCKVWNSSSQLSCLMKFYEWSLNYWLNPTTKTIMQNRHGIGFNSVRIPTNAFLVKKRFKLVSQRLHETC